MKPPDAPPRAVRRMNRNLRIPGRSMNCGPMSVFIYVLCACLLHTPGPVSHSFFSLLLPEPFHERLNAVDVTHIDNVFGNYLQEGDPDVLGLDEVFQNEIMPLIRQGMLHNNPNYFPEIEDAAREGAMMRADHFVEPLARMGLGIEVRQRNGNQLLALHHPPAGVPMWGLAVFNFGAAHYDIQRIEVYPDVPRPFANDNGPPQQADEGPPPGAAEGAPRQQPEELNNQENTHPNLPPQCPVGVLPDSFFSKLAKRDEQSAASSATNTVSQHQQLPQAKWYSCLHSPESFKELHHKWCEEGAAAKPTKVLSRNKDHVWDVFRCSHRMGKSLCPWSAKVRPATEHEPRHVFLSPQRTHNCDHAATCSIAIEIDNILRTRTQDLLRGASRLKPLAVRHQVLQSCEQQGIKVPTPAGSRRFFDNIIRSESRQKSFLNKDTIANLHDFISQHQRNSSQPDGDHLPYVLWKGDQCVQLQSDGSFRCCVPISTPHLLRNLLQARLVTPQAKLTTICLDSTFGLEKHRWNLLVIGTVDIQQRYHGVCYALVSVEDGEMWATTLQACKDALVSEEHIEPEWEPDWVPIHICTLA